jgi:small subunit ribosomal protein S4
MAERKKFKIQRAIGIELPGLGKAGALEKRNFPPGQHGRTQKRKLTEFGSQLREKQKLIFHYGLREEQLRRYVRQARRMHLSDWMESLLGLLERRIDNLVFRLGFAKSIAAARQLVSHGHVRVNGRRQTVSSMVLRVGDVIALSERANQWAMTLDARSNPRLSLPSYLTFLGQATAKEQGRLSGVPHGGHVPFEFSKSLVAEYYAKRGV